MKPAKFEQRRDTKEGKVVYFKWALSALMLVLLVSTFGFDADALDVYKILGPSVLATVLLLLFGVRTTKGSWIVGSTLLGVVVIGLTFFVKSLVFPASVEEMSGLWMVAIFIVGTGVAFVGASSIPSCASLRASDHFLYTILLASLSLRLSVRAKGKLSSEPAPMQRDSPIRAMD